MAVCSGRAFIAKFDLAVGLVGLPSNYAKDIERQGKLHAHMQ